MKQFVYSKASKLLFFNQNCRIMFHYESFILMRTTWIFNQCPGNGDVFVMWLLSWSKNESQVGSLTPSQKSGHILPTRYKHAPPIATRSSHNVVLLSLKAAPKFPQNCPQVVSKLSQVISKLSPSCPKIVPKTSQSCFQVVSELSQGDPKVVSKLSPNCFQVLPRLS